MPVKVKGLILGVDGEGEIIGEKQRRSGVAKQVIDQGNYGKLLKVRNERGNYEIWQIGVDDIEIVECTNKNCSECICEAIKEI